MSLKGCEQINEAPHTEVWEVQYIVDCQCGQLLRRHCAASALEAVKCARLHLENDRTRLALDLRQSSPGESHSQCVLLRYQTFQDRIRELPAGFFAEPLPCRLIQVTQQVPTSNAPIWYRHCEQWTQRFRGEPLAEPWVPRNANLENDSGLGWRSMFRQWHCSTELKFRLVRVMSVPTSSHDVPIWAYAQEYSKAPLRAIRFSVSRISTIGSVRS